MVNSNPNAINKTGLPKTPQNSKGSLDQAKNLISMCKMSANIINKLYNPLDAVNRFINLALQNMEEGSQSRQFLLESKQGIRKTSVLLKKLNNYTKKIERELSKISIDVNNE